MASFTLSPGVEIKEKDLTNVVPAVSSSIGAIAGAFRWGPVEEIRLIGSEKELVSTFGTPDDNTFLHFMTAASFLQYGNALKVVRAATGNLNADSDDTGVLVKNREDYDANFSGGDQADFIAKYPGVMGNSIDVEICPAYATAFTGWDYKGYFTAAPSTSDYVSNQGGSLDEMHIVVVDRGGTITGTAGEVLELFAFVSQASDAKKADGTSNYYKDVINTTSKYVWWGAHNAALTAAGNAAADQTFVPGTAVLTYALSGGTDDNAPTVGELELAYDLFDDAETVDCNLLFAVPATNGGDDVTLANYLIAIAEGRKDLLAFISPPVADSVNTATPADDVIAFANQLTSSSYAVIDSSAVKVYDKYNDVYRWIPACGLVAGLCANTDRVAESWFSPAGFNRGQLLGVSKLAYNPKKADRDALYLARVNPLVSFAGQGTVLFGDKTALSKPSAFDRINVRRLFITLEKAISTAAKYMLFELNDEFTRAMFRNMVEPYLRDVQGRRGITDFFVVCDETNNTGEVIDSNNFVGDIYIKPARSINSIRLNFVATRTGVEFSEIVGA